MITRFGNNCKDFIEHVFWLITGNTIWEYIMSDRDYYGCPLDDKEKEILGLNIILIIDGCLPEKKHYFNDEDFRDTYRYCHNRLDVLLEDVEKDLRPSGTYKPSKEMKSFEKTLRKKGLLKKENKKMSIIRLISTAILSFFIFSISVLVSTMLVSLVLALLVNIPILKGLFIALLNARGDSAGSFIVTVSYLVSLVLANMFIEKMNKNYPTQVQKVKVALAVEILLLAIGNISAFLDGDTSLYGMVCLFGASALQFFSSKDNYFI